MYLVDGCVVVHSGRPVPAADGAVLHREGVGIVLNPVMTMAWRNAGEVWNAVSSRIVTVRLLLTKSKWP